MNSTVITADLVPASRPSSVAARAATGQKQYLTFRLGSEMFALDILCIKEIIWYASLTVVPMMPNCIRGVINLRGAVVPVMDLSARFARDSTPVTKSSCIVIAEVENVELNVRQNMGIVVDAVQAVLEIPSSDIESPPNFGARIHTDFIDGIAKVNGKFVIVLDVHHTLSFEGVGEVHEVEDLAGTALA